MSALPRRVGYLFALALALSACAQVPTPALLVVRRVDWNPGGALVGHVAAVGETPEATLVLSDRGAWLLSGGVANAHDPAAVPAVDMDLVPAATGHGAWLAVVGTDGHVRRLDSGTTLEDITPRYGLDDGPVLGIAGAGRSVTAFALDHAVAISDGLTVSRFACPRCTAVAGGGGRVAVLSSGSVMVFDPAAHTRVDYRVPDARWIAVDTRGRLAVATPRDLWVQRDTVALQRVVTGAVGAIHGLAAVHHRVWFTLGTELGTVEEGRVAVTRGAGLPPDARLVGATGGDVWSLAHGRLTRYATGGDDRAVTELHHWEDTVGGVFHRACVPCHGGNGRAGLDLSTRASWELHRTAIAARVLASRTMPPPGNPLSDADREAIRAWLAAPTTRTQSP